MQISKGVSDCELITASEYAEYREAFVKRKGGKAVLKFEVVLV